jgi:hypothetical protein
MHCSDLTSTLDRENFTFSNSLNSAILFMFTIVLSIESMATSCKLLVKILSISPKENELFQRLFVISSMVQYKL